MNRFDGMKYKEIADNLGISVKTVEVHMGKALKFIREKLPTAIYNSLQRS
jgi:RNA polymerase sigma-70 factor (ECF subfamily)